MNKIKVICSLLLFLGLATAQEREALPETTDNILLNRLQLNQVMAENIENSQDPEIQLTGGKSVGRAVLYSAIVPGAGQFYANSYVKAAAFVAVEALGWAVNISNNSKGDDKDREFKAFADENWSEQRYWSYVYDQLYDEGISGFPDFSGNISLDDRNRPLLDNWREAEAILSEYDNSTYLQGFTHELPLTKTQQYYEMIGKYPEQFGNAWEDASFSGQYSGYEGGVITAFNQSYTLMRNDANRYYKRAGWGSAIVLMNHFISAIDAGFTTRGYNQRLQLTYDAKPLNQEFVSMFGLQVAL